MEIDDLKVDASRDEQQDPRDGVTARGTSGDGSVTGGVGWPLLLVAMACVLAVGVINALSTAHDLARRGSEPELGRQLFWELSSTVVIAALVPVVASGIRRLRILWKRKDRVVFVALALAAVIAFSAAHIVGMVLLRTVALAIYGSVYRFDWSLMEVAYEFRKDVATAVLFAIVFWLAQSRRDGIAARLAMSRAAAVSSTAAPAAVPDHIWLRDGATSIRIIPSDILWVSSAGNYIEYRMADGTTHLIRATLASEEGRLQPFSIARVHRTRMVNLNRVVEVTPRTSGDFEVRLDVGETIVGSRRYRDAVLGLARSRS